MTKTSSLHLIAQCSCGQVKIEIKGDPIAHTACYCKDCQSGGRQIEALPRAAAILDADGGTDCLECRKDRLRYASGEQFLKPMKLTDESSTSRVIATCCNAGMYLSMANSHWLSVYSKRIQGNIPPLQLRVWTKYKRADTQLPADVPNFPSGSIGFYGKLFVHWILMLLRIGPRFESRIP